MRGRAGSRAEGAPGAEHGEAPRGVRGDPPGRTRQGVGGRAKNRPSYAALWVRSNYSFLEGASHPEELVERAHALGVTAIAMTDRDGVYGMVRAHVRAKELGVRVIVGAQVTVRTAAGERLVVLLAETRAGYAALCRLLSAGRQRCLKGSSWVTVEQVAGAAGGLLALCPEPELLAPLRASFGDALHALCTRHLAAGDVAAEQRLRAEAALHRVPVVAGTAVLYHDRARRPVADVLCCIRHGCTLAEAGTRLPPNAEHDLLAPAAMRSLFADDLAAVNRSLEIAARCTFHLGEIRYRYPLELPAGLCPTDHLRELTFAGARERYGESVPSDVREQLERELAVIGDLDYGGYFLTMYEVVRFCHDRGILCQGRGSAANSAVCFCLGITAIDPVRMDLLFERFLSRERAEPPDIDLDIEHDRREEVIQHVYERYGRRHAAMVANVIRYRARSALREVGKVLGVSAADVDGAARLLSHYATSLDASVLEAAGLDPVARSTGQLLSLTAAIIDFPRHLSIHPGGFLLGHEPVDTLVPIEPATMPGRTVIQWDKQDVEDLGLFKVDLLGLGALTAVHACLDLLRAHGGPDLEVATVPAEDPETYEMIAAGDTVGVFQIESRAQMAMLPRLRPRTFYDLVIEVAIVRPGPIQGDMVHPYLKRRKGEEPVSFPHECLERVLRKTLGVPIFQEQVMKLAVVAADYTPGEADQLRRDMAAWRSKGRIERHHERLVPRMIARGIPEEFAERVFSQIRGFGEYGFPESHAASFALLAYVTAWLKCHHPAAFTCALLNAQPMGFYSPSTLVEDARRHGVEVLPVDAERSRWDCTLTDGRAIRMGLRYVKGLGESERGRLEALPGPHGSLEAFARTAGLSRRCLVALAEAGALSCYGLDRRQALWAVRGLAAHARDPLPLSPGPRRIAFRPLGAAEEIAWDYRASRHSTRGHPMASHRDALRARGLPDARAVTRMPDGRRVDYVGMVICRQRPGTASGVTFFTMEDETGFVNIVVWKQVFEDNALIGKTASLLGVRGRLQVADGVTHLVAEHLYVPTLEGTAGAAPRSRDFH